MIKVLIVAGEMSLGGIENQLMHLVRNADKEQLRIDFTSTVPDGYFRCEIEALGSSYIQIPPMSRKNPFPYCHALYRVMKDGAYDIVHSHELFHSGIVLLIAALANVKGRFVHAHNWQDGIGDGRKRSVIRCIYNRVMQMLIRCCSTHQLACSTLAGKFLYGEDMVGTENYHLVYNSVDTAKFLDNYHKEESGEFCDEWINVLQVGRITPVKNQLFLAEVASVLRSRNKKIRILCAGPGTGEYPDKVNAFIHQNRLNEYIKMLGPRSDIDSLMRKSSAFVLPSHYEGMPLVLIEAQASGLPCVCADTFSHEVDFDCGRIHWLPISACAETWADAIEAAVSLGRQDIETVTAKIAEKRFDSRQFAQTLCNLYIQATQEF